MVSTASLTREMQQVLRVFFAYIRANYPGVRWTVTSARRTAAEQAALYRRLAPRGMAVAPPGRSKHQQGRAADIVFQPRDFERTAGEIWEALGGRWGGRFQKYDGVHFEDPYALGSVDRSARRARR